MYYFQWSTSCVSGRYLPTRSNEDSLDKLRDLLRDVSSNIKVVDNNRFMIKLSTVLQILESDKPASNAGSHLGPSLYEATGHYAYGGPKYLRKREINNGWDYYGPVEQQPLH